MPYAVKSRAAAADNRGGRTGWPSLAVEGRIDMGAFDIAARAYSQVSGTGGSARPAVPAHVLVVEDEEAVAGLFRQALSAAGYRVHTVSTATEALRNLGNASYDIAFFDIHLPDVNGFTLLERCLAIHPRLPIVMVTGHADVDVARRAIRAGASDFLAKPFSIASLPIIVERNVARRDLADASQQNHRRELQNSYETVLSALLTALNTRHTETEGHSERVTAYTMVLAEQLGVSEEDLYHIERGALLHDVGKIGVPDRILHKPGPLTREEWEEMRRHPAIGHRMCARIEFLRGASEIILHHHERWDGTGYPDGLRGGDIPLGARIFAVVDAFEAMTTDRPYRSASSYPAAAAEIRQHAGTQFDPTIVEAFLQIPESTWQAVRNRVTVSGQLDPGTSQTG